MEKIETISRRKTIDYSSTIIENFWEKQSKQRQKQQRYQYFSCHDHEERIIDLIEQASDVVCIFSEYITSSEIVEACYRRSSEIRIYIMLNDISDHQQTDILKSLSGNCLIRHGFQGIGSFILIDPSSRDARGILFSAPLLEGSLSSCHNVSMQLDKKQLSFFYRYFCHHFWESCQYEVFSNDDMENFRQATVSNLEFLPPDRTLCERKNIEEMLKSDFTVDAFLSLPNINSSYYFSDIFSQITNSFIVTSLQENDSKVVRSLSEENDVYAVENNLFHCWVDSNKGYLFTKSYISLSEEMYVVELNDEQRLEAEKLVLDLRCSDHYRFFAEKPLGQITSKIKLQSDIENELTISDQQQIDLGNISMQNLLSKPEMRKISPDAFDPPAFVRRANYRWQVIPPYLPTKAKKAKIYEEWNTTQNKLQQEVANIKGYIEEIKSKSEKSKVLSALRGLILGKNRQLQEINTILESMDNVILSQKNAVNRSDIISRINEIQQKLEKSDKELSEGVEKEQQKEKWEKTREDLNEKIALEEIALQELEEKLKTFEESYQRDLEEKQQQKMQEKQSVCNDLEIQIDKWEEHYQKLDTFINTKRNKSEKKRDKEEIIEAKETLRIMDNAEKLVSIFENSREVDRNQILQKIEMSKRSIGDVKKELQEHGETFVFQRSQQKKSSSLRSLQGGVSSNTVKSFTLQFPEELPQVGELYEQNKKRYLVIEYWEQIDSAEKEAARLEANICIRRSE